MLNETKGDCWMITARLLTETHISVTEKLDFWLIQDLTENLSANSAVDQNPNLNERKQKLDC